jgi:hypothetical protein
MFSRPHRLTPRLTIGLAVLGLVAGGGTVAMTTGDPENPAPSAHPDSGRADAAADHSVPAAVDRNYDGSVDTAARRGF